MSYEKVEFSPRVDIRFNIWDTWGVNDQNYEGTNMLNNFLDGAIPDGFPMDRSRDQAYVSAVMKNNSATASQRHIHAVLMFVKVDTDQNAQDVKLIQKYLGNCTAKGKRNEHADEEGERRRRRRAEEKGNSARDITRYYYHVTIISTKTVTHMC